MDTHNQVITTQRRPLSTALPGSDREIAAKIAALLLHYPIGNVSDAARAQMAQDWLEDLREFGPYIVGEGCRMWRQKPGGKRPTPGDVRSCCIEAQAAHRALGEKAKNDEQKGGDWGGEKWLYELWGPESTGRPARDAAIAAQEDLYRRAAEARGDVYCAPGADLAAEGRALLNKWAVRRGYADWNAAWDANMKPGMPPGFLQRVSEEVREMRHMRQQPKATPEPRPTRSELAERYNESAWTEPEHDPKEDAEAEEMIF